MHKSFDYSRVFDFIKELKVDMRGVQETISELKHDTRGLKKAFVFQNSEISYLKAKVEDNGSYLKILGNKTKR